MNRQSLQKNIAKLFWFSLIFLSTFSVLPNAAQSIIVGVVLFLLLTRIKPNELTKIQFIKIAVIVLIVLISYYQSSNVTEFHKRILILLPLIIWTIISPLIRLNFSPKQLYYIKFGFLISIFIYIILFLQFYLFGLDQYYGNDLNIYPMLYNKLEYNSLSIIEKMKYLYLDKNGYLNVEYTYSVLKLNNEFFRHHLYISLILTLGVLFSIDGIQSKLSSKSKQYFYGFSICVYLLFMLFIEGQSKWMCISIILIIVLTKIILPSIKWFKTTVTMGFMVFIFLYLNSIFNFFTWPLSVDLSILDKNRITILQTLSNSIHIEQIITGIGMGDIQDLLNANLPKNILSKGINNQYVFFNTHNQYIDILLSFGVLGLIFFLSIVFNYIAKYLKVTTNYSQVIYIVLLLSMLFFENLMNRSWGVSFLIFYLLVLKIEFENAKYINY